MRPLRNRLDEARKRLGVPWEIIEGDYLLSWVLAGIADTPSLRDTLAFKGGPALKKCYFGDYRFSEDLDFSAAGKVPSGTGWETEIRAACHAAAQLIDEFAPVAITCDRYVEKEPHPGGQEAFVVRARFPWQRQPQTRVMIEITIDERVLKPTRIRPVIHEYGEPMAARIPVYALEEILAEKLRAILQHAAMLEERGWSRSRARDYYDLWRLLATYKDQMKLTDFAAFLGQKCAIRKVVFRRTDDFFSARMLAYIERTWDQWLGRLVPRLPPFRTVIDELRPQIDVLLASAK